MKQEISQKLEDLEKYTKFLKKHGQKPPEEIEKNPILKAALERYLQITLECMLEIGEIIISQKGYRKPKTYKDVIQILGEQKIIPPELAEKLKKAAGLRNILVHNYQKINTKQIIKTIKKDLKDIDKYAKHTAKHTKK